MCVRIGRFQEEKIFLVVCTREKGSFVTVLGIYVYGCVNDLIRSPTHMRARPAVSS